MGNRWDGAGTGSMRGLRGRPRDNLEPLRSFNNARPLTEWTGCTYRQLDYWCRAGYLGTELRNLGSGGRRTYTATHYEVAHALAALSSLGAIKEHLQAAADVVAARPVTDSGEVLVLHVDGRAHRFDKHACLYPATGPCWVVPLRPAPAVDPNENVPAGATARTS